MSDPSSPPPNPAALTRLLEITALRLMLLITLGVSIGAGLLIWFMNGSSEGTGGPTRLVMAIGIPCATVVIALVVILLAVRPWDYTRDIADMLAGEAWAHWRYDEAEWHAGNRIEVRNYRGSYTASVFTLLLGTTVLLCGLGLENPQDHEAMIFVGAFTMGVAVVGLLVVRSMIARVRGRRTSVGDVYISPLGIYRRPGGYTILQGYGTRVHGIEFVDGPSAVVHFVVQSRGRRVTERPIPMSYTVQREQPTDVLVPAGREDEARRLVERFRNEVL